MHLRDGEFDGAGILPAESAAAMRHIIMRGKTVRPWPGLVPPGQPAQHRPRPSSTLGGGAGYLNLIRISPCPGRGIAIMGNATNYPIDIIATLALART